MNGPTGVALERILIEQFGAHASALFADDSGLTLSPTGEGYLGPAPRAVDHPFRLLLPADSGAPFEFRAPDGFVHRTWDEGRRGRAIVTPDTVSYSRDQGAGIWRAGNGFGEQWIYLPHGAQAGEIAAYRWSGGTARQHGRSIDIYDSGGRARLTVSAPEAISAAGGRLDVALQLREDRMVLMLSSSCDQPMLVDPVWVAAGDMAVGRTDPRTVLLDDGRVLAAGGLTGFGESSLASAELFDPMTDTWSVTASMAVGRYYHTITRLADGRVLAVGGEWPLSVSAEIFDPATELWFQPAQPLAHRQGHTTMLLHDGRALVAGARYDGMKDAELYDPGTDTWSSTGPMQQFRADHRGVVLPSGDVFVSGGSGDFSAELFSPQTNSWTTRASGNFSHEYTDALLEITGTVLLPAGGVASAAERYDPQQDSWTTLATSAVDRMLSPALWTGTDQVLIIGGNSDFVLGTIVASTEFYDAATDSWSFGPSLQQARATHAAELLQDGRVLVVGGGDGPGPGLKSCELLLASLVGNGSACSKSNQCASGYCVGGMCCDNACDTLCFACSVMEGADVDGTCGPTHGIPCDDGDVCTTQDACVAGVCAGTPVVCPSGNDCHVPYCDAITGACGLTKKGLGSPCGSGGLCDPAGECVEPSGSGGAGGAGQGGLGGAGGDAPHGGGGSSTLSSTGGADGGGPSNGGSGGTRPQETRLETSSCSLSVVGGGARGAETAAFSLMAAILLRLRRRAPQRPVF